MSPNAVARPVATTSAVAVPLSIDEPRKTMFCPSAGLCGKVESSPASFSTGIDSPVSAAWLACRSRDWISRASAGARSPADSRMTSPGTSARPGTWASWPSRSAVAVTATWARSISAACCERWV
jgi:hypothetical protein